MKIFEYLARKLRALGEIRPQGWPPITEPRRYRHLAEPSQHSDRASVLKRRIAEINHLYSVGSQVTDLAHATRSPEFTPEWPSPSPSQMAIVQEVKAWMVSTVCRKRSAAIPRVEQQASTPGKLLVYEVNETVWDGASEAGSKGYFDSTDEPGWNTWIDYYEDYEIGPRLLCYVPLPLVELVQCGIDANPVDCIGWIECPELVPPS